MKFETGSEEFGGLVKKLMEILGSQLIIRCRIELREPTYEIEILMKYSSYLYQFLYRCSYSPTGEFLSYSCQADRRPFLEGHVVAIVRHWSHHSNVPFSAILTKKRVLEGIQIPPSHPALLLHYGLLHGIIKNDRFKFTSAAYSSPEVREQLELRLIGFLTRQQQEAQIQSLGELMEEQDCCPNCGHNLKDRGQGHWFCPNCHENG